MPDLDPDDLGLVVWAALGFDRRLPGALVPPGLWEALTPAWRDKINSRRNAGTDDLGAEIKKG